MSTWGPHRTKRRWSWTDAASWWRPGTRIVENLLRILKIIVSSKCGLNHCSVVKFGKALFQYCVNGKENTSSDVHFTLTKERMSSDELSLLKGSATIWSSLSITKSNWSTSLSMATLFSTRGLRLVKWCWWRSWYWWWWWWWYKWWKWRWWQWWYWWWWTPARPREAWDRRQRWCSGFAPGRQTS